MALPASKTRNELKKLNDEELIQYYLDHARYFKENPPKSRYAIQLGSKALFSDDTAALRDKFIKAVRAK